MAAGDSFRGGRGRGRTVAEPPAKVKSRTSHFPLESTATARVPTTLRRDRPRHVRRPVLYTVADGVATIALEPAGHAQRAVGRAARRRCSPPSSARATTTTCAPSCSRARTRRSSAPAATSPASRPTSRSCTSTPAIERFPRLFELIGTLGKPTICAARRARARRRARRRARLRPRRRQGDRDVRHARDQRRRLPVHDHGADLPQRPAQEGERAAAARRAHRRRARPSGSGIVNRVVPAGEFDAAVADWAAKLAAKSPLLMRMGKDAMWRQQDLALVDALDYLRAQLDARVLHRGHPGGRQGLLREARPRLEGPLTPGTRPRVVGLLCRTSERTAERRRRRAGAHRGRRGTRRRRRRASSARPGSRARAPTRRTCATRAAACWRPADSCPTPSTTASSRSSAPATARSA